MLPFYAQGIGRASPSHLKEMKHEVFARLFTLRKILLKLLENFVSAGIPTYAF